MAKDVSQARIAKIRALETLGSKIINTLTHPRYEDDINVEQENQISLPITSSSIPQRTLSDLYPLLRRFVLFGTDLMQSSLVADYRKPLRILLMELDNEFRNLQRNQTAGQNAFTDGLGKLHERVRNIINFVVNYDRPASEGVAVTMSQLIDFLNKFTETKDLIYPRNKYYSSEVIRRIHEHARSFQRNKITLNDLDKHLYRIIEELVTNVNGDAISGRKNAIVWSLLMSSIIELQEVTSCLTSNISACHLYLTPSERLDLETNLNHLSQLSSIFFESISRVIRLDANYITIMEQTSVLLVNSMYLLYQAVDAELFLWNPVPKYICNHRALKNHDVVKQLAKKFTHQIGTLSEIISTCLPSSETLQKEFDKLFATCQRFIAMALDHGETLISKSNLQGHEDTWHNIVSKMLVFIHNAIKSLAFLTGSYPIGRNGSFGDLPKLRELVKALANDMKEMTSRIEESEKLKNEEKTHFGEEYNVSDGWIERLKSMRHLLLRKFERYSSLVSSTASPSSLHQSHDNNLPSDISTVYSFDSDCLLLLMVFCKAQVVKSRKFVDRKEYDPLIIMGIEADTNPARVLCDRTRLLSDGGKGWEDEDSANNNELIDIIESIIRECHVQQLKENPLTPEWAEQLNEKIKRLDEMIPFLSSHASDERLGSNMETSLELVSSLVFQIDATSRFNVFTGHKQFSQDNALALIENLSESSKGLLEDLKVTAKQGFQSASNPSEKEQKLLDAMSKWKE